MSPMEFVTLFLGREEFAALADFDSMDEAWEKASHDSVVWIATRRGVLTDAELLGCASHAVGLVRDANSALSDASENWLCCGDARQAARGAISCAVGCSVEIASWLRANTRPDWERARKDGAR